MDIKQQSSQTNLTPTANPEKQAQEIISSAVISQFLVRTMAKDLESLAKTADQERVSLYVKPLAAGQAPPKPAATTAPGSKPPTPPQTIKPAEPPRDLPMPDITAFDKTLPEKIAPPKTILLTEKKVEAQTRKIDLKKILMIGVLIAAVFVLGIGGWFLWGIFSAAPQPSPTPSLSQTPISTATPTATPIPLSIPQPPFTMEKQEIIGLNLDQKLPLSLALQLLSRSQDSGTFTQAAFKTKIGNESARLITFSEFVSFFNLTTFGPTAEISSSSPATSTSKAAYLRDLLDENQYFPFVYYQTQDGASPFTEGLAPGRIGLIVALKNGVKETDTKTMLKTLEPTMPEELKDLLFFTNSLAQIPEIPKFLENVYKNFNIRYVNFPFSTLTLDYAIVNNYLLLTTSKEAIYEAIDRLLSAAATTAKGDQKIDISGWQTYRNTEYGFEIKYPPGVSLGSGTTTDELIIHFLNIPTFISSLRIGLDPGVGFEATPTDETIIDPLNIKRGTYRAIGTNQNDLTFALWFDQQKKHNYLMDMVSKQEQRQQAFNYFDQILSTFKFIQ